LAQYRTDLYACFGNGRDALMNACDALLTQTSARSLPELSLSPFFTRRWPSLYEAFDDGAVDRQALQRLFVGTAASGAPGRWVLAADATPIVRPQSPTARDRTSVHVPNLPVGPKPVAPGWQFATVVALPQTPSSWTTLLDNRRIQSGQTAGQVVAGQLQELSPLLPDDALVVCDGGFGNPTFLALGRTCRKASCCARPRTAPSPARPHRAQAGAALPGRTGIPL
jgi:hypothetical protein